LSGNRRACRQDKCYKENKSHLLYSCPKIS
jgi:hypothetical protein